MEQRLSEAAWIMGTSFVVTVVVVIAVLVRRWLPGWKDYLECMRRHGE